MKITALALAASLAAFIALPSQAADNPFAGESFKMAAADGGKCGGVKPAAGGKCGGVKPEVAGSKCGGVKPDAVAGPKCGGGPGAAKPAGGKCGGMKPAADKAPAK